MTSLSHRYREFGETDGSPYPPPPVAMEEADEDVQLAAFENGYQAGWEDATKALQTGSDHAALDISQRLQDMSFTHREATTHLNAAMQPLISQIVNKMLPKIAQPIIGAQILEQIGQLIDHHAENAIEVAVAPENLDDLREMLAAQSIGPFTLVPDPKLKHGQAYLRVNQSEREINFDAVLAGISEAFDAFYEQMKELRPNG